MFRFGDPGGRMYQTVGTGNANVMAHWSAYVAGNTLTVASGAGRTTGSCLRFVARWNANYVTKTLDPQATWGVAFAFRASALLDVAYVIASFTDSSSPQVDVRLNTNMTLVVTRNGAVLGTSTATVPVNSWVHLELRVLIHPSAGTVDLRMNGVPVFVPLTGQNTRNTANSSANAVNLGQVSNGPNNVTINLDYDDIIVYDSQPTDANGFADIVGPIGDCRLTWIQPTANGANTNFALTGAASNAAAVNEAQPDTGTGSYVESSTVGQIDTYAAADTPTAVTQIKSVALVHYAKKTDAGSRGMRAVIRSASLEAQHATEFSLSDSYLYYFSNYGKNPNGVGPVLAWDKAGVDALEIGQKVSS